MSCEEPPPATKPPTIASAAPPAAPEASSEAPPAPAPAPWTAEDDRVLVDAVEAGASLEALAELKLMQAPRTLEQLRERWQALLFDEGVARSAAARLAEASTAPAAGPSRYLAGGAGFPVYRVLPRPDAPKTDQAGIAEALASEMLSYSDAENAIVQAEQGGTVCTSSKLLHGIKTRSSRKELVAIAALERTAMAATSRELQRAGALAALCGSATRFLVTQHNVLIGRSTEEKKVDIDLALEGCATKVSREQAHIKLRGGHFKLINIGRRAILVNNCLVESGHQRRLENNCLIEVGGLRFLFQVNTHGLHQLRKQNRARAAAAAADQGAVKAVEASVA